MSNQPSACVNCGRTSQEIPVFRLEFQAQVVHICPQCLPTLIHKPHLLIGKLPGAENLTAHEH